MSRLRRVGSVCWRRGSWSGRGAIVALLLTAPGAAPAQELPLLEHARIDPRQVVTAEACGECHLAEHEVWESTPHATGFRTLHKKEQALKIAGKLGFRLIKRDSICFSCHYTPIVERGRIRVDSGVSCESCHGAGRGWVDLHNDYGDGFDHSNEPAAHRRQRIEASRAAGMRRPSDLYPVVANCFSCHTVPNEDLVNVAGHTTGSSDFEFVEWSQGEIRHNFLDSTLAETSPVNAERPMSRKRVMFVVGRALDLEYSLRGVAEATRDGVYAKAMIRRVKSAVSELRAIHRAASVAEVGEMLDLVRKADIQPGRRSALLATADRIGAVTRRFLDRAEPERLAGLDDLVLGREPPLEPEAVVAAADPGSTAIGAGAGPGAGVGAAGGAATPSSSTRPAGVGSGAAAGAGSSTVAAATGGGTAAAAGPIRSRLRPPRDHDTVGPGACSGCHTRQNEWWFQDAHYASVDPFFDGEVDNRRIATLYGLQPSAITLGRSLCMDCHGTVISGKESREVLDGVSCESCHGPAADWLEPHKDETGKELGRRRPGHLAALQRGKSDLRDLSVRAAACVGCHYVTDPRLLSAGHPSGAGKDWVEAMTRIRHWESGPAPAAELRAAYGAATAARGPVPNVRRAVLASSGGAAASAAPGGSGATGGGRPTASLAAAPGEDPAAVLALRPPPPRPIGRQAAAAADDVDGAAALELPPFPDLGEATPVDELLAGLQERLEMLYRLVAGEGGE